MHASLDVIKKKTTPLVWLIAALLVLLPPGQHAVGAVLCIGQDGHVAAEGVAGTTCASSHELSTDPSIVHEDQPTHCGPCIDILLPTGGDADCASFKTESGPTAQVHLPIFAVLPSLTLSDDDQRAQPSLLEAPATVSPTLTSLRSTVLLL